MNLSPMRYKDYVWEYNPRVFGCSYKRQIAALKIPGGGCVMQDLGKSYKVLSGEGEFTGENAYRRFRELAEVFEEGGAGILAHPVWQMTRAFFVSLTLRQEPRENYVAYSFEFWEDITPTDGFEKLKEKAPSKNKESVGTEIPEEKKTYTVVRGDTMWAIAARNGMTLYELIAKNPQIKNPNLIYPGDILNL